MHVLYLKVLRMNVLYYWYLLLQHPQLPHHRFSTNSLLAPSLHTKHALSSGTLHGEPLTLSRSFRDRQTSAVGLRGQIAVRSAASGSSSSFLFFVSFAGVTCTPNTPADISSFRVETHVGSDAHASGDWVFVDWSSALFVNDESSTMEDSCV